MPDPRGDGLSDNDRQLLSVRADEFYQAVTAGGDPGDWDRFLAGLTPPLRRAVLHELVIIDMAHRWDRGDRPMVEDYVRRFPEVGPVEEVAPALILEEHRCRVRAGEPPNPDRFRDRFPVQFPKIEADLRGPGSIRPEASSGPAAPDARGGSVRLSADHGSSVGGQYERTRKLGEGAFAEVWEVVKRPSGIRKAMKILFQPADGRTVKRELQSLEIIKNLRHACLLSTDDFWIEDNRLHIIMELADATLRGRLDQCRAAGLPGIPRDELIGYLLDAAKGLDYLHHPDDGVARVVHRDVKPDNILILKGQAKVADFGLVRQQGESIAQQSIMAGTLLYMAPEMYAGEGGPASDQYGLAFAAVEVLQGRPPLTPAKTLHEMMITVLDGELAFDTEVTGTEQEVFRKALDRDPAKRYPSCYDFAADLARTMGYHVPGTESRRISSAESRREPRPPATPAAHPDHATLIPNSLETERSATAPRRGVAASSPYQSTIVREPVRAPAPPQPVPPAPPPVVSAPPPGNRVKLLLAGGVTLALLVGLGGVLWMLLGPKPDDNSQARTTEETAKPTSPGGGTTNGNGVVKPTEKIEPPPPPPSAILRPPGATADAAAGVETLVGGRRAYKRVVFPVAGEEVAFRLITPPGAAPFYLAEGKVTNAAYRAGSQAKQLPVKVEGEPGGPQAPVMNVLAEEAEAFARAVFGGHLPLPEEWDAAAGVDDPQGPGPTRAGGKARVRLAAPAPGPGSDEAASGVRDLAGNGREWTRAVIGGKRVGDGPLSEGDRVILRGRAYFLDRPLTYDMLRVEQKVPQTQFGNERSPYTGFRVVVPLPEK